MYSYLWVLIIEFLHKIDLKNEASQGSIQNGRSCPPKSKNCKKKTNLMTRSPTSDLKEFWEGENQPKS